MTDFPGIVLFVKSSKKIWRDSKFSIWGEITDFTEIVQFVKFSKKKMGEIAKSNELRTHSHT